MTEERAQHEKVETAFNQLLHSSFYIYIYIYIYSWIQVTHRITLSNITLLNIF